MAALCRFLPRRADALALNRPLHLCGRLSHSQSLWEELLGRKIEPAVAKRLEEAFLEYRVRKAVPSWLPFFPNGSFWIQPTEDTIKNLEVLAERIRVARPVRKERVNVFKPTQGTAPTVAEWSVIQLTDKLLSLTNSSGAGSPDALFKPSAEKGTLIEVEVEGEDEDEDEEDEDDSDEEELETDEKQKP